MASVNKSKVAEAAQKFLAKGQIDKALKEYEKILGADPGDASTRLKVGDLRLRLGQKEPAVADYRRVADKFTQEGFYSKAVAVYKRIIAVEPQLLEAHLELASLNQRLGLLSEVVHHYQLAANIHDRRGEKRQAIDILKKVADVGPPNLERKIKVAELYYREGLKDSGFEQFSAAMADLDPQSADLLSLARRMAKAFPDDPRLIRKVAELCGARGDHKAAVEALEEACGHERDPEMIELLAESKAALDLAGEAKSLFEEAANLYRTRGDAARSQALSARALEIASASLDVAAEALETPSSGPPPAVEEPIIAEDRPARPLAPSEMTEDQHLEAALSEADVYQKYGKHDRAVTILEELSARYPSRHEAPLRLRAIFEACEDWTSVAIQCRRLARVAEGRGDPDRAARFEEEALQADLRAQGEAAPPEGDAAARGDRADSVDVNPGPDPGLAGEISENQESAREEAAIELAAIADPITPVTAMDTAPPAPIATASDEDGTLGDIELVIEGEDEPGLARPSPSPAAASPDRGAAAPAGDELELCLDEEPIGRPEAPLPPAAPPARGDEPDLILDDALDEPPVVVHAAPPVPESGQDLGEIELDLEETVAPPAEDTLRHAEAIAPAIEVAPSPEVPPEAPAVRSVEEDLILQEISAEAGSLPQAEEIVASAGRPLAGAEPEPDSAIALQGSEPPPQDHPAEDEEILLVDAPTDEDLEGGALDPFNEALLREGAMAPPGGIPEAGDFRTETAPRARPMMEDGGFELDLDLDSDEAGREPWRETTGSEILAERAPLPGDSGFDLRAELDMDAAPQDALAHATEELSDLVSELQQREESVPSPEDAQTHYDLGIAYKEMGLLDDAIRELKMAARDSGRRIECLAVLGICYCEQGKPEEALGMFEQCLALGGATGKGAVGILYEMGLVHEESGNTAQALECYRRVAEIDADYRETRARVARLRGAGPDEPREPSRPGRSKRISYL